MNVTFSRLGKLILAFALVAVMALTLSHNASAAPQYDHRIIVESTADNNTPDTVFTLREALLIAHGGTDNGVGLGRPLTDSEANLLYGCQFTGYEPDHWWIDGGCGAQDSELVFFYLTNCPCVIAPTTPLPFIAAGTTIDGYLGEPGASPNTSKKGMNAKIMIQLYGGNIADPNAIGLEIGDNVTVKGLEIYGFPSAGISVEGQHDTIVGNIIDNNAKDGIGVYQSYTHVGGINLADRNAIYQNGGNGVQVGVNAPANQIVNNLIGVPADNDKATGNTDAGVLVSSSSNYMASNTIAYNGMNGVQINSGIQNNFYNNSFHDNYKLGIDLGNNGVTPNDAKNMDSDTGANNLQNYPTLTSAASATKYVKGKLVSKPNTTYQIDVFKTGSCDANGYGEGKARLGSFTVQTNSQGVATFGATVKRFKAGNAITAVASGSEGTSEFSKCFKAQ